MAEYKQIRLNPDVRGLLDDYKMQSESYSIAIGRLFKENQSLKEDKENLIEILNTRKHLENEMDFLKRQYDRLQKDSEGDNEEEISPLLNGNHFDSILTLLEDEEWDDERKFESLKEYVWALMDLDSQGLIKSLETIIKEDEDFSEHKQILCNLIQWIKYGEDFEECECDE